MTRLARRALQGAVNALRELGDRPASLLLAMLALHAFASPYAGLIHDAQLYGFQVQHRLEAPLFDDDLFFLHGSQDQYSVFSLLAAPLAAALGLPTAFFLLYLAGKLLLFLGMLRLVRRLLSDRVLATLSLLFLAVHGLPYGAFGVFSVNEPFLTPRLFAVALALLGLERMVAGRYAAALALVVAALLVHPVMAAPALGVLLLWWAWARLPGRWFTLLTLGGGAAAAVVLASAPLAVRVFGQMDPDWLGSVLHASPYAAPLEWPFADLLATLVPVFVLIAAASAARGQPPLGRLALLAVFVALGGLGLSALGSRTGYALLLQGQFYRALWLTAFLQVPLGFWLATQLWPRGEVARLAALTVLGWLLLTGYEIELLLFAWPLPVAVLFLRGLGRTPRTTGWLWQSYAVGLAFGALAGAALKAWFIWHWRNDILAGAEGLDYARVLLGTPGPAVWTLLAVLVLAILYGLLGLGAGFRRLAVAAALAVELAAFAIPETAYYQEHYRDEHQDIVFVSHFLDTAGARTHDRVPSLYWHNSNLHSIWFDLHVKSYFQLNQVQGLLFSRQTAEEARRRARVVRNFEMERRRQARGFYPEGWTLLLQDFHGCAIDEATAGRADLERLCQEKAVDFAVLSQAFDGLYAASNGRVYVYDCRRLREQLSQARPAAPRQHES